MVVSGGVWGCYSLLGRSKKHAAVETSAGNFLRATPLAVLPFAGMTLRQHIGWDAPGLICALVAGALTSGVGYALWYSMLPVLSATTAASVQLSVPVITTFGGAIVLREQITLRLIIASLAVLGGIALVVLSRPCKTPAGSSDSC